MKYFEPRGNPAPRSVAKDYRKLRRGTLLRKTDKVYISWLHELYCTAYAGERVCAIGATAGHYYRRKSAER